MLQPGVTDSTRRFSDRVENYIRYRPTYPGEVLECLKSDCGLVRDSVVADIGSGTGILAERFLINGNRVFGVEPNLEMREAGERLLKSHPRFTSIAGTAESTTLPKASIDFVTAGQAFHWFDPHRCRFEFQRILRPDGWIALVWNDRRTEATSFLKAYEELLLEHSTDYEQVNHKRIDAPVVREFFGADPARKIFPNYQHFDLPSLRGRLLSSSYVPGPGQPGYAEMMAAVERVFESHQENGQVIFEYDTVLYYGRCVPS
jgi:SAM-dependent methyltransferase